MHFSRKMLLHLACLHGAFNCLDYLLATKDGRTYIDYYNTVPIHTKLGKATPLMLGALHGPRMVRKLLDAGASITVQTQCGRTLLHLLMMFVHEYHKETRISLPVMVNMMVEAGSCVNSRDINSFTPLSILMTQVQHLLLLRCRGFLHAIFFTVLFMHLYKSVEILSLTPRDQKKGIRKFQEQVAGA